MNRRPTLNDRASGLLLHPTSLPNEYPIGDLGPAARNFADFLAQSGQRWWQMLPVGPAGPGNSPYQASSAFAGNPNLISPEMLRIEGFVTRSDATCRRSKNKNRVDYVAAGEFKQRLLRTAYERYRGRRTRKQSREFEEFTHDQNAWLEDFALFSVFSEKYGMAWNRWPNELRSRLPRALAKAQHELHDGLEYYRFVQWQFARQWRALKAFCGERGIGLIGDIPIFVSLDSADVWAHPELFKLRPDGKPQVVAGVPPDFFAKTGQRWGNPHYRWEAHARQNYRWWIDRLRQSLEYVDVVRLDHYIGFVRFYEIPGDALTAEKGRYRKGPGAEFFSAVTRALKSAKLEGGTPPLFIAEDLGTVTPEVKALRDRFQLPGMKVLQFAFGKDPEARNYQPHRYAQNAVVYTGTHDNDTTVGWFNDKGSPSTTRSRGDIQEEKQFTLRYLHSNASAIHWDMIRAALSSVANTSIFPIQDVLGLGSEARMNQPGTPEGNWSWRMREGMLSKKLAKTLRRLTEVYERAPVKRHKTRLKT